MKVVAGEPEVLVLERCGERTIREARQQRKEEGDPCVAPLGAAAPTFLQTFKCELSSTAEEQTGVQHPHLWL